MAIRYTRDYDHILDDLSRALLTVPQFYEAFEMEQVEWDALQKEEQEVCVRTLADDLFYMLGAENTAVIGSGTAEYDPSRSLIRVTASEQLIHIIALRE
ncbi:MAG: hypothetical protein P0Y55_01545 [Candidatus Cohnella colombiensis]|uniref:Uncharacterized protein n=1 Tax=Candidatus Cohnella colombiensis TaxID=3121368 RepID=A0AA95JGC7_9BACL|nr:MAG: hypothetical protein P0Y55_01545 [Cohnella sp.]